MIQPLFSYCDIGVGQKSSTINRFKHIQEKSHTIVFGKTDKCHWKSIETMLNSSIATSVFKCVHGLFPSNFNDTFKRIEHGKYTRTNKINISLPKIKTETARQSFKYKGAKTFNDLPNHLKNESSPLLFNIHTPCIKCEICSKGIRKRQTSSACHACGNMFHSQCLLDYFKDRSEKLFCKLCNTTEDTTKPTALSQGVNVSIYQELNDFLKARGMKFFHQNVNGLFQKLDQLNILFQETKKNIHIFGITESHLDKNFINSQFHIDGYEFIRKDRKSGKGGGVACFIRNDINWQRRQDLECDEIESIWIEIFIEKSRSILLSIIYRPPDTSKYLHKNFKEIFDDTITTALAENKESILMGDINCNFLKRDNNTEIKDIFSRNGLKQVIKNPTRTTSSSKTLIDIIATTHENIIQKQAVFGNSLSDHDLIGINRKMNHKKFKPRKILTRDYSKYNCDNFRSDLKNLPWQKISNFDDVNSAWFHFKDLFTSVVDKHAPVIERTVRGLDCPWLSKSIKAKINERDYLLKNPRRTNQEKDWSSYRKLRNFVTKDIKISRSQYNRTVFRENLNKPKQFWNCIKLVKHYRATSFHFLTEPGAIMTIQNFN